MLLACLVGSNGSGKTTVANELIKRGKFKKLVTYTTREPRDGEVNDIDYHFITNAEMNILDEKKLLAERVRFGGYEYATPLISSHSKEKYIVIVDPNGLLNLRKKYKQSMVGFYLDTPVDIVIERLKKEGLSGDRDIKDRLQREKVRFSGVKYNTEYILDGRLTVEEIADQIEKYYNHIVEMRYTEDDREYREKH